MIIWSECAATSGIVIWMDKTSTSGRGRRLAATHSYFPQEAQAPAGLTENRRSRARVQIGQRWREYARRLSGMVKS